MKEKDKEQLLELFEKHIGEELAGESHFYQTFGQNGWSGVTVAFRHGRELDADCTFVAATLAEAIPWQILKRAAELGKTMKEMGVSVVELVPGWCAFLDEQGNALPEDDDDEEDLF